MAEKVNRQAYYFKGGHCGKKTAKQWQVVGI